MIIRSYGEVGKLGEEVSRTFLGMEENPQAPETLEAENPGEKTPKDAPGSSCITESFSGLAPIFDISIEANVDAKNVELESQIVEVEKRIDGGGKEMGFLVNNDYVDRAKEAKRDLTKSPLCEEENEAKLGLVQSQSEGKLVDLGRNGNEDFGGIEMVQDEGTSEDKKLESNVIDSSRKIGVSTEGISLFVEISGFPSRHTQKDVDVGNFSPLMNTKEKLKEDAGEEQGKSIDNRECAFLVGDIVWVQTKNQTWWPGKIHDPKEAPKYATRSGKGDDLLVGYYGISHFAWCRSSQLNPFHENFERKSGENGARIFLGAVEKAVDEFGRRVKREMTCSCASVHDQLSADEALVVEEVLKPELKSGRLGEFSVTCFEPVMFLEHLKYLAEVVSMPHMLDFTVTHNRLSAFYLSVGHRQLPMGILAEKKETEEDKIFGLESNVAKEGFVASESRKRKRKRDSEAKVEDIARKKEGVIETGLENEGVIDTELEKEGAIDIGFNSRERKKSRYLSYPYTNWEQKSAAGMDGPKVQKVTPEASTSVSKSNISSGEKFWRKWYRRFTGASHIPTGSELKTAASAELLCELRSAAVDCLHPNGNNNFDPICWFLSRFRISVFNEESVGNEANGAESCWSGDNALENLQAILPDKPKRKRSKKKENSSQVEHTIHSSNAIGSTESGVRDVDDSRDPSLGQDSSMVKKNGEPNSVRLKTKALSGLSDVSKSIATNGLSVRGASEIGSALKNNKAKQRKKRKGEVVNGDCLQAKLTTGIPDLNGSSAAPSLLADDPQVMSHVTLEVKTEPLKKVEKEAGLEDSNANTTAGLLDIHGNNAKPGTLVVDLRVPGEASACLNNDYTADLQDIAKDRPTCGLPSEGKPVTIGQLLGEGKPGRKKRKRKEKEAPKNIPDLNGASTESSSLGKESQETTNGLTPPAKPVRKRRRRKEQVALNYPRNISISWRADMNLSYNRMETNKDTIGTALLLTFAPGGPMPSGEDLVSTFSKFGTLKESETRFLKDPGSAQIVFTKSADATVALKSIEKNNPFGAALVNYRLHHLPTVSRTLETNRNSGATLASSTQVPATPPLDFIRQNLQMMTSMLETSGDNLSPEMRAKLEAEVKGLLSKVSSMAGSCS